jgi:hypothetical protein
VRIEPRLRRREARKPGDCCRKIDRFPFWIEARCLQLVDPRKKVLDKARDAIEAVGAGRPIVGNQRVAFSI